MNYKLMYLNLFFVTLSSVTDGEGEERIATPGQLNVKLGPTWLIFRF